MPINNIQAQQLRSKQSRLSQERERLRVRAKELQRQRLILENELQSPGATEAERDYLQQRIQTLSRDEDGISMSLANIERQLAKVQQESQYTQQRSQGTPGSGRQPQVILREQSQQTFQQVDRLKKTVELYSRKQGEREKEYNRLRRGAKKAFFLIGASAIIVAAIADVLSIIDIGWMVSWLLPIISGFIVRKINAINTTVGHIQEAQQRALRDLKILRQRLRPALLATRQMRLFMQAETLEMRNTARSYVGKFVRDTLIFQTLELIPVVDWLPLYLGNMAKVLYDQHKAYQNAQSAMLPYRKTLDLLAQLENFELEYISIQIDLPRMPIPLTGKQQGTRALSTPSLQLQPA